MAALDSLAQLNSLLEEWVREHSNGSFNVMNTLHRMAELLERETEEYYKMDPDPFDDRHPGRAVPTCALGHLMKTLFKSEEFMNKLVSTYLMSNRDNTELHIAASRLLLDVMPGLETTIVFQETDGLVRRLLHWAEFCEDPLRSYATGLLAGAMELQDVADKFKEANGTLVPLMLTRLHKLKCDYEKENQENTSSHSHEDNQRHFGIFGQEPKQSPEKKVSSESPTGSHSGGDNPQDSSQSCPTREEKSVKSESNSRRESMKRALSPSYYSDDLYRFKRGRIREDSISKFSVSLAA